MLVFVCIQFLGLSLGLGFGMGQSKWSIQKMDTFFQSSISAVRLSQLSNQTMNLIYSLVDHECFVFSFLFQQKIGLLCVANVEIVMKNAYEIFSKLFLIFFVSSK